MSNSKGFWKGAVIGGIVAGAAALLFAPKSGEQTRNDLKKKLDETNSDLKKKLAEAKKSGSAETKELIRKGEILAKELSKHSDDLNSSAKKVSGVAADEGKLLVHKAGELMGDLAAASKKVAKEGKKEYGRLQKKMANTTKPAAKK